MAIAGALEIQLFAGIARLQKDMNDAKTVVGSSMRSIEGAVASAKNALGALGIGLGVNYFARFLKGIIDTQDELSKLSQKLNIPVEQLAGLRHAADLAGVSGEALTKGFKTLSSQMFDSSMGLLESKRNFGLLGIEVQKTDGTLRDTQSVMLQVADKFAGMQDGAAKSALAVKLFGKAGLDMIPLLNEGSAAIAGMIAEGQRLNPVTAESARQAEIFNDNMTRVGGTLKGAFIQAMNAVLPGISDISKAMAKAAEEAGFWTAALVGLGGIISKIFQLPEFQKANKEFIELTDRLMKWQDLRDTINNRKGSFLSSLLGDSDRLPVVEREISKMIAQLGVLQKTRADFEKIVPPPANVRASVGIPDDAILKKAAAEKKKLLDADMKGWVAFADFQIDEYERELKEIEKMSDEHWKNEEKLRQEDIKGWVAYAEAIVQADFDEAKQLADIQSKTTDEIVEFWRSAAQSMQSSMSDFFFDIMQGKITDLGSNFKRTIDRMMSDMIAAQAAMALFGKDFGKGGSIGGLVGDIAGWVGGKFSGTQSPAPVAEMSFGGAQARGGDYMVTRPTLFLAGEAGPERATFSGANRTGSGTVNNFTVDMRGASVEAVARLERLVMQVNGSIESRAVAATTDWSRRR